MIKILLYNTNWKYKQHYNNCIYVCGWAEYEKVMYDTERLQDLITDKYNSTEIKSLKEFFLSLNGNFSIIINSKDKTLLCVDKMRCYPVMYFQHNKATYVTDDIYAFLKIHTDIKLRIDENIVEQYLCSNFVFGPYTIYEKVFSVQSGEFVVIINREYIRRQYFQRAPKMDDDSPRNLLEESSILDAIFIKITERMIKSASNVHNWIIPLSGGHDSRLIANYLYKLGVKNVICYTYGIKNQETIISEKVAKALDYEWYFIEYTPDAIAEVQQSKEIDIYRKFAFNGTSVPHLQDFVAVYMLKKRGIIQSGDIFVPGHAHEVLAGSHLKYSVECCHSIHSAMPFIKQHFGCFGYAKRGISLINHVLSIVEKYDINANQISEYFDWQERQTKFVVNSVRVYEYFGFEWRIPQWDNEVIDYWDNIGYNYRYGRSLYFSAEKISLLVDALKDIPFANDMVKKKTLKEKITENIPLNIKKIIRCLGYSKSSYFSSLGTHLIYSDKQESIKDYRNKILVPIIVKKYLSNYPGNMKLRFFEVNSVSTLLIIKDIYNQ